MARPHDTAPSADREQLEALRRLGAPRRLELALEMSEDLRRISIAGVRRRHPEYDEETARRAVVRLVLGDLLTRAAWPDRDLIEP